MGILKPSVIFFMIKHKFDYKTYKEEVKFLPLLLLGYALVYTLSDSLSYIKM